MAANIFFFFFFNISKQKMSFSPCNHALPDSPQKKLPMPGVRHEALAWQVKAAEQKTAVTQESC